MSFKSAMHGMLNAGHRRSGSFAMRTVGDDHEPRQFSVWGPKAVALIGRLPSTLNDRSIEIRMRRRQPDEKIESLRFDREGQFEPLRRRSWTWAQDNLEQLRSARPAIPTGLNDRAADNWSPLIAIAARAGGDWPDKACACALQYAGLAQDDSDAVALLEDIKAILDRQSVERIRSVDLLANLCESEDRPWAEWRNGKPLTPVQLARLLKSFEIRPKDYSFPHFGGGNRTAKGYAAAQFSDAFNRYIPQADPQEAQEPPSDGQIQDSASSNNKPDIAGSESEGKP